MQILTIKLKDIEDRAKEIITNCEIHFEYLTGYIDWDRDSVETFLTKVCRDLKAKEARIKELENALVEIEKTLKRAL